MSFNPDQKILNNSWQERIPEFGGAIFKRIHHGILLQKEDLGFWGLENKDASGDKVIKWNENGEMREKEVTLKKSASAPSDRSELH